MTRTLLAHLGYLGYVLRHKYWVFVFGMGLKVPVWRLIIHDASKFSRAEWGPYRDWFYTLSPTGRSWYAVWKEGESINVPFEAEPYARARALKRAFDAAWRHHWERNRHHWEHWADQQPEWLLPMPETYAREMVADWFGAGYAQGKLDVVGFYRANGPKMRLHPETRALVEQLLELRS
jgi:hypothetical protein